MFINALVLITLISLLVLIDYKSVKALDSLIVVIFTLPIKFFFIFVLIMNFTQ